LKQEFPEIKETLEKATNGDMSEGEAMASLLSIVQKTSSADRISEIAMTSLATLREEDLEDSSARDDMSFQTSTGVPTVNPLYHAALAERLQFDEDIPEYRTGPIDENTVPAVPVDSNARNPVALGHMLQQVSEDTSKRLVAHRKEQMALLEAGSEETRNELVKTDEDLVSLMELPTYRRGELPVAVATEAPSGASLALMTVQECKEKAWKFFSTTQGRRSAINTVTNIVKDRLGASGFAIEVCAFDPTKEVDILAHHEWSAGIFGKENSIQSSFAVVDNAAAAISESLLAEMANLDATENVWLEVVPVNTVDIRQVGWAARLVREKR